MFMLVVFCIAFDNLTKRRHNLFPTISHLHQDIWLNTISNKNTAYRSSIRPKKVQSQNKEIHKQQFKKGYNSVRKGRIRNPALAHNYVLWVAILEPFKIIHTTL